MNRLMFYTINPSYMAYLHEVDSLVPHAEGDKARRPFVGIVFEIGEISYFAPLTSYKHKFSKMRSGLDLIIIEGDMGAINLNNMIPVHPDDLEAVEIDLCGEESEVDVKYKVLLEKQLEWCNEKKNRENILKNAAKLHSIVIRKNASPQLLSRCCDFAKLERSMTRYCHDRTSQA